MTGDNTNEERKKAQENILGLSTTELAGLSVDELLENKTAITMLLYYYQQMVEENNAMRNDINTYQTYVTGYDKKHNNTQLAAILFTIANIGVGFGVSLFSSNHFWPGIFSFGPASAMIVGGIYLSLRK